MGKLTAIVAFLAMSPVLAEEPGVRLPGFQVIVNAQNPVSSVDRKFLADMFYKKVTQWPEDGAIRPVDLRADSPVRKRFSEEVMNRSVMGVKSYWQQRIFSGQNVPPPELTNEDEVIRYVLRNPGSVGYVSGSAAPPGWPKGVKTVAIK